MDVTGFQHIGIVAHFQCQGGILFHEQKGESAFPVQINKPGEDGLDQQRGDAEGGLVEHQAAGSSHQRSTDGEHLLLAATQCAGDL